METGVCILGAICLTVVACPGMKRDMETVTKGLGSRALERKNRSCYYVVGASFGHPIVPTIVE